MRGTAASAISIGLTASASCQSDRSARSAQVHGLKSVVYGLSLFLLSAQMAGAAEVTMGSDVLPPAALGAIAPIGSGATSDPCVYTFTTANGLDMAGWKIYGNNQSDRNTVLNLNGGSIVGTQSATAFDFHTLNSTAPAFSAHLTMINVRSIKIGKVWTYVVSNYGRGDQAPYAGNVTVGTNAAGLRAGKVEIAEILTHTSGAYATIPSGAVTIDSTNDVSIWDGTTRGDINTSTLHQDAPGDAGSVVIRHHGAFQANNILTYRGAQRDGGYPASILLNGDILGTGPVGSCLVNSLSAISEYTGDGVWAQNVTVQGYKDITVADGIYTYNATGAGYGGGGASINVAGAGSFTIGPGGLRSYTGAGGNGGSAGSISIATTGGAITVNGPIDAHGVGQSAGNVTLSSVGDITLNGMLNLSAANKGVLSLGASRANSVITLPDLDLGKMQYAVIAPGSKCILKGDLIGFSTNVASQTQLRMPAGKRFYYYPDRTNNAYLAKGKYILADVTGVPANGGVLMPYVSPGTVITVK
ncbi:MAG: hypothetical protein C0404_08300 [Verrucomicrobia bacterium]|nr:hypothetical protein [Verrucomicrobiota bacterium]